MNPTKRESIRFQEKDSHILRFLYQNHIGHVLLRLLVKPFISKIGGKILDSRPSRHLINGFVKRNNISLSEYEQREYTSYNDFFTRKAVKESRPIDMENLHLISPCDARLLAFPINAESQFSIKGGIYSVEDLLMNAELAKAFRGGQCLIFRLCVQDYHRYCYFDTGTKSANHFIGGELHTVRPIALTHTNIYKRNCREYTVLNTKNFGQAVQIEVGAMMVGKIKNFHQDHSFSRGEEKGMFEFGGSTIVVLLQKNVAELDKDILSNSNQGWETLVKYGEKIGQASYINTKQEN